MPRLGFLLGAGASAPFGIPMMREFYERFINYVKSNRSHCLPLVETLVAGLDVRPDLETLIERLEQLRQVRSGLGLIGNIDRTTADRLALADELRGYLDMFLIETCENFSESLVESELSKFVALARELDAYIFTTNYDRLIEVAATSIGLKCSDGFDAPGTRPEALWNGDFSSGVRLIKLHGSVNWYEEEDTQALYRLERGYSLPSSEYRLVHGYKTLRPLMIIPTLEKAVLKMPYSGLLTQFSDALKEIDLLVVIGNSLRDDHLRNTVITRAAGLNVLLVNPAARDQMGILGTGSATYAVPLGTREFIAHGLDRFRALATALAEHDSADDGTPHVESFAADLMAWAEENESVPESVRAGLERLRGGRLETALDELRSLRQGSHAALLDEAQKIAIGSADEALQVAAIDAIAEGRGSDAAEALATIVTAPGSLAVRAEAALALQSVGTGAAAEIVKRVAAEIAGEKAMHALFNKTDGE